MFSKGLPRLINIICDNALFLACGKSQPTVSADIIGEVVANLRLVPSQASALQLAIAEQPPTLAAVSRNGHPSAVPVVTVAQGVRSLTEKVRTALAVSWRYSGRYIASGAFLALLFGLFLVYGRQGLVAAPQGRRVERQGSAAVVRPIASPTRIIAVQPNGQDIRVAEQQKITFMVNVSHPQADLQYRWLLDGQEQSQGNMWVYEARVAAGRQQLVTVQIRNPQNQTVERSWKVDVQSAGRSLVIAQASPTTQTLTLRAGRSQDFSITTTDSASTAPRAVVWFLDGQEIAHGPSWTLTPSLTGVNGQHRVTVTVRDNNGRTVEKQWTVTVENES